MKLIRRVVIRWRFSDAQVDAAWRLLKIKAKNFINKISYSRNFNK